MALLFLDSFGTYSTFSQLDNKWTTVPASGSLTTGQFGAPALDLSLTSGTRLYYKILPANTMRRIGFWISGNISGVSSDLSIRSTNSNSTTVNDFVKFFSNGAIGFYNGAASAVSVGSVPAGTLKAGRFHWFEIEIKSSGITCYVDGILIFSYTGSITVGSNFAFFSGNAGSLSTTWNVSHLVIWDDTGTTFNSFPIGPQRTQTIRPTAAGAAADWTPASGANWQAVDASGWGGGVGVSTLVTAQDDKHNCADLAWNSYKVRSVVLTTRAVDLNSGGSAIAPLLQDASGTAVGSYVNLPMTNPTISSQNFDKDSAGGDWTKAKIDAMQIGYRSQI